MRHELLVHPVVAGDILKAVGELLPRCKELFEVTEATRHRLAACIDDLRPWKHQVNETEVAEVVRHLVDEERPVQFSVNGRVIEIPLSETPACRRIESRERCGKGGRG